MAQLSAATAEGRLTIEEFSERSRQAYASRSWGELSTVVHDLPMPLTPYPVAAPPPAADQGSKMPLLAMILGILSLPLIPCLGMPLGGLLGAAAIALGVLALKDPAPRVPNERGMAITGLVCGSAGVLFQVALLLMLFFGELY